MHARASTSRYRVHDSTGLSSFGEYLGGVVSQAAGDAGGAKLEGIFVLIEVLGSVGERAGIARRALSARAASAALDEFLARWLEEAALQPAEEVARWNWKNVVPATSALQARRLLDLLDPEATVFFSRTFVLGEGHVLKPSWTLGYALSSL